MKRDGEGFIKQTELQTKPSWRYSFSVELTPDVTELQWNANTARKRDNGLRFQLVVVKGAKEMATGDGAKEPGRSVAITWRSQSVSATPVVLLAFLPHLSPCFSLSFSLIVVLSLVLVLSVLAALIPVRRLCSQCSLAVDAISIGLTRLSRCIPTSLSPTGAMSMPVSRRTSAGKQRSRLHTRGLVLFR